MSNLKKNILYNAFLSVSQILFPIIIFPYISRILGPEGIGKVSFIDSLTQYFILFSSIGIPLYGIKEMAKIKNPIHENKLFSELIFLQLICTVFFLFFYVSLYFFFDKKQQYFYLLLIGSGMLISNVFLIEWFFQAKEKFGYITKRAIILRVVFILLMFVLVKKSSDTVIYYFLLFLLQLINGVFNFYFALRGGLKLNFIRLNLKKHIKPLLFLSLCSIVGSVYLLLDNIILGFLDTNMAVGYYSTAIKIAKVPLAMINVLGIVLIPKLSEFFKQRDFESVSYYIDQSFKYVLTIGVPLSIFVALTSQWIIPLISGDKYTPSIILIRILSPIILIISLNCVFFFQIFTTGGNEKQMIIILGIGAVFSVGMNFILIPSLSSVGTSVTTTLTELLILILSIYFCNNLYKIRIKFKYLFSAVLSSVFFPFILFMINGLYISLIDKLCLGTIVCASIYYVMQKFIYKNEVLSMFEEFIFNIYRNFKKQNSDLL